MLRILILLIASSCALVPVSSYAANQSLSPKTYQALNEIQVLLTEEKFVDAEVSLIELEGNLIPGFGLALTYQIHAQLYLAQEDNAQALSYFNKALDLEAMKAVQAVSLSINVAQLYLTDGQLDAAITVLTPRVNAAEKEKLGSTNAMAYITLGSAFQLNQDFKNAVIWFKQGIARAKKPRENWLQMLMAAHFQLKQYTEAARVLDQLIVINDKKEEYWLHQASLLQMLNKPKEALKVLQLAHLRNVLEKEDGLIILVQLLITQGAPERAGRILLELLEQEKIDLNDDNWNLLGTAWLQSRERKQAITAFIKAAEFSQQHSKSISDQQEAVKSKLSAAKLYYRSAQLQFDESDFNGAVLSFTKARALGITGRKLGLSLLMQGNAYFELEDYVSARVYFTKALKEASSSGGAKSWLDYMHQLELFE